MKHINFNIKQVGRKSPGDQCLIKLLKSPAIIASGVSTVILYSNPNEVCDRSKFLLHEKRVGDNCNKIDEEIFSIADNLLKYNCISTKRHKFLLLKGLN